MFGGVSARNCQKTRSEADVCQPKNRILSDLVARGLLSQWQAKIIGEHGKFKGFIQDRYVIVCGHRQSDDVTIAEAYDKVAKQYVLLKVSRNAPTEFLMPLSCHHLLINCRRMFEVFHFPPAGPLAIVTVFPSSLNDKRDTSPRSGLDPSSHTEYLTINLPDLAFQIQTSPQSLL